MAEERACIHGVPLDEYCGVCVHEASTLDEEVTDVRIMAYHDGDDD